MTAGEPMMILSPCGVNCSYTVEFEGPWFECVAASSIRYLNSTDVSATDGAFIAYSGSHLGGGFSGFDEFTPFEVYTYFPIAGNNDEIDFYGINVPAVGVIAGLQNTLSCVAWRAKYTLINTYENNIYRVDSSAQKLALLSPAPTADVSGITANSTTPGNWSTEAVEWYRDANMFAIAQSMIMPLIGNYTTSISITGPFIETTPLSLGNTSISDPPLGGGKDLWTYDVRWTEDLVYDDKGDDEEFCRAFSFY
jgi:hypothetical protein